MNPLSDEYNIFYSNLLLVPIISFLIAVLIKGFISQMKHGKFELAKALASGGMPSVHSALVSSTTIAIAIKYGVNSDFFTFAIVLTVIVMYDAINVRYEAGLHAAAINESLGKKFKESLGHLPSEAFAGAMLGIFIATILFYF